MCPLFERASHCPQRTQYEQVQMTEVHNSQVTANSANKLQVRQLPAHSCFTGSLYQVVLKILEGKPCTNKKQYSNNEVLQTAASSNSLAESLANTFSAPPDPMHFCVYVSLKKKFV